MRVCACVCACVHVRVHVCVRVRVSVVRISSFPYKTLGIFSKETLEIALKSIPLESATQELHRIPTGDLQEPTGALRGALREPYGSSTGAPKEPSLQDPELYNSLCF